MDKDVLYARILLSQAIGLVISAFLVRSIFVGAVPIVRYQIKDQINQAPGAIVASAQKIPHYMQSIYDSYIIGIPSSFPTGVPVQAPSIPSLNPTITPQPTSGGNPILTQIVLPTTVNSVAPTRSYSNPTIPPANPPTQYIPPPTRIPPTSSLKPTQVPTSIPQQQSSASELEKQVVDAINAKRQQEGLGTLSIDSILTTSARKQSTDNSQNNQCDHISSDGKDTFDRARDVGYTGQVYGETVACMATSPQQAVDLWWESGEHKMILIEGGIRKIGVGWVNNYQTAVVAF